jgi:hypothetical protein
MEKLVAEIKERIESNEKARKLLFNKIDKESNDKIREEYRIGAKLLYSQNSAFESVLGMILREADEQ